MASKRQTVKYIDVRLLIQKSLELAVHNNAEAYALIRKALSIARRRKDASLEAHTLVALKHTLRFSNKHRSTAHYDVRMLELCDSLQNKGDIASVYNSVGRTCIDEAKHEQALEYLYKAKCLLEEVEDPVTSLEVLLNISTLLLQTNNHVDALRYAFEGLSLVKENDKDGVTRRFYGTIGIIYMRLFDFDKALYYFSESLALMKKHRDHYGIAITLTNIGSCYNYKFDFRKALEYIQKSLSLLKKLGLDRHTHTAYLHLASLYLELGDNAAAMQAAKKAYRSALHTGSELVVLNARVAFGTILYEDGKYQMARKVLLEMLNVLQNTQLYALVGETHRVLSQVYAKLGLHKEAYHAKEEYEKIRSDMRGEEQLQALQALEIKELLDNLEYKQEVIRTRALQAEVSIQEKEQQLQEQTQRLSKSTAALTNVEQSVQPYLRDGTGAAKELALRVYESLYRTTRLSSGQVSAPVLAFDVQYEDYIRRLFTAHPELTPTEMKVCLLIKLHYPNKSISDLLNISVLTVKTHRTHIRKKMNLHPHQDLLHVLTVV